MFPPEDPNHEDGEWGFFPMASTACVRYRGDIVDDGDPPVWRQMVESVDVWPAGEPL